MTHFSSKLVEDAVNEVAKLPGIGRKTALRLVLHLLKKEENDVNALGNSLIRLRKEISYCNNCHNVSDQNVCDICSDKNRDTGIICVVEDIRDVMAIENTGQFKGYYHVLGGIISPMDGIGPKDLTIESLVEKASQGNLREVFLALRATIEGDTTNFYIYKKLKDFNLQISAIARGISVGDEIEYTDEITLGRSIINRIKYENSLIK